VSCQELDGIGVDFDVAELRLPAPLFGMYDDHISSHVRLSSFPILGQLIFRLLTYSLCCLLQVAEYCRDKIYIVIRDVLRAGKGLREVGEVDIHGGRF
jgi:hypothetical protein